MATVAVAVRDRRAQLLACLDAILGQDYPCFEVLVLDNCSTDGTAEAAEDRARSAQRPVRVERVPGSLGRVRNRAGELARGEVLAFTDSDCVPAPGWLGAGVAALVADERVGVVQGHTEPAAGESLGRWAATQHITGLTFRYECCNLFYRLEALRKSEGFDEEIGFFGEDMAAGWSVRRLGWQTAFEPAALVHHAVTHPGLRWHLGRAQRYGNMAALVKRFPEMRREYLWARYFLRRRNAAFAMAIAGVGTARLHPAALLLAAPYAWYRRPRQASIRAVQPQVEGLLFDGSVFLGLLRGSIRHRRLVL